METMALMKALAGNILGRVAANGETSVGKTMTLPVPPKFNISNGRTGAFNLVSAKQFNDAIRQGDAAAVDAMIAAGADVNAIEPGGHFPPLYLAIEHIDLAIVRRLVQAGADVNRELEDGWTPLAHAIDIESDASWQLHYEGGRETTELCELLLAAGAIPTARAFQIAEQYDNDKARRLLNAHTRQ